jgi:uncharacterized protein (DUF362 family)
MKRAKTIIIYSILVLLCIAAIATAVIKNERGKTTEAASASIAYASIASASGATVSNTAQSTATASQTVKSSVAKKISNANNTEEARINEILQKSQGIVNPNPIVGIGQGKDYAKVTQDAVKNAGGLESIVKKGNTVLIKPNICVMAGPGDPRITDYRIVKELVDEVKKLGASKVIIAEGSFSGYTMETAEYNKIKGVQLIDFNEVKEEDCFKIIPEKGLTGHEMIIPKIYMQADVVISVAKLKTHGEGVVSLSLKNSFGIPPMPLTGIAYKEDLHTYGMSNSIVDLNKIRRPDFVVIDGIVGGEGMGPTTNTPVDSQIIFAGIDPVATDTAAAYFMGFPITDVPHIQLAADEQLGVGDLSKIKVIGADLEKIKRSFRRN